MCASVEPVIGYEFVHVFGYVVVHVCGYGVGYVFNM